MSNRFLLSVCFCLSYFVGVAQRFEQEDPSITLEARDTIRIQRLIEETYTLRETNPKRAMEYCLTAVKLSKHLHYKKGEGRALGSLVWIYYRKGDFLKALEISNEALKISEKISDLPEVARSLNNVGAIYYEERQYDKALEHVKRALRIAEKIHDESIIVRSLNNIANLYEQTMISPDSAQLYATQALIRSEKIGSKYYESIANHTMGELLVRKHDFTSALKKLQRALALSAPLSDALKIQIVHDIAEVYVYQDRIGEAITLIDKNIATAKKYGYREELMRSYQLLAECYRLLHNVPLAYEYLGRYSLLHDSIYNEQNSIRLATLQSQSDLDKKQTQIELLTKDTLLNKEEIRRQRIQLSSTIGGLIGILLLAGILFYGNRKFNRTNILLQDRTTQLARLNNTKDKLFSIISHDFRSPLNSLKGLLGLLENKNLTREEFAVLAEKLNRNFNAVSNDLENLLQWSLAQLKGIQTNVKRIDVRAIVQEHIGLFHEIALVKRVELENRISEDLFALADEDHIRLVLRNLINNAIKFTPPGGAVQISSFDESPFIKIVVADTGVGIGSRQLESLFQKDKAVSTRGTNQERGVGLGLLLCQEFVENNGGQLVVASELGKGSVFSFTLRAA
jgi:two-component system, sensor histidine kinase and response regulator